MSLVDKKKHIKGVEREFKMDKRVRKRERFEEKRKRKRY